MPANERRTAPSPVAGARISSQAAAILMRRATLASVVVAVFLIAIKFVALLATGSVSMLSTLVDSVLDAFASTTTMFAVNQALAPADREHRFGHGKAEPLASVGQAAFIAGSASFVLIEAGLRLGHPKPLPASALGIGVMVFAIAATLGLVAYQQRVVRLTGSLAISGDRLHYVGDLLTNLVVIASLVLGSVPNLAIADPLLGAAISLYLLYSAWTLGRRALAMLMDEELPETERARIRAIVLAVTPVRALHDLRTRASGRQRFMQFHLELDGDMSLTDAHAVSDRVEAALRKAYPEAEIIIHQDPAGIEEVTSGHGAAPPERAIAVDLAHGGPAER